MTFYNESIMNIVSLYIDVLRKKPKFRLFTLIFSLLSFITSLILSIFAFYIWTPSIADILRSIFLITSLISILIFLINILSFTNIKISAGGLDFELKNIRDERERIKKRLSRKTDTNIFDTVQFSLNQLTEYYTINKSQARSSYRWSVFGILVGLITLLTAIWIIFFQDTPKIEIAIISGISGILIEFLSATNFYIYRKSIIQLNYFFQELIKMQDTMLAIGICNGIEDEIKKNALKEYIIKSLIERCLPNKISDVINPDNT